MLKLRHTPPRASTLFLVLFLALFPTFFPATPAASAEAGVVRMAWLQNDLHHLPLWIAQDQGFFEEEGVRVVTAGVFRAGPEIMTAFAAGALDAAYVGEAPVTIAFARGNRNIRVLAQVNLEGSALVARRDGPLRDLKDLRGKTVAVPGNGTVQDFLLRRALAEQGLDAATRILTLPPPEMTVALEAGHIDAFLAWQPYPARAALAGTGRVLARSGQLWPGHPCCVLAVRADLARSPEAAALLRAHVRALEFLRDRPEDAVRVAVRRTGMKEDVVRQALKQVAYAARPNLEGEEEYVRFLHRSGYINAADSAAFTRELIDATPLENILQSREKPWPENP